MTEDLPENEEAIGMYVKFDRRVDPDAFADLKRLPKGTARVQRVRLIFSLGLRSERATRPSDSAQLRQASPPALNHRHQSGSVRGIFDDPIEG
jgi:hypothetical protein